MKSMTRVIIYLLATAFVSGCKSSSPTEPIPSKTDFLTGSVWILQKALALGPAAGQTTDVTSQFPFIVMTFTRDGYYQTSVHNGTWEFIDNESSLLLDKNSSSPITAKIVELSATVFHFMITTPSVNIPMPVDLNFIPQPPSSGSPSTNFEALWKEFDAQYSFFVIKNINWDSLHAVYRPQVSSQTTDIQLFQILSSLLGVLKDPHVSLTTPFGTYQYTGWFDRFPANFLGTTAINRYLSNDYGTVAGGYLRYGKISGNLGYLYVGPNLIGDSGVWNQAIDVIIDSLKGTKGIIVDIRNNGGGNDGLGSIVAGRFADQQRNYSYTKTRNGPLHTDFTDYQVHTIQPQGFRQFLKPVALLTNRRCLSSAEGTILMFKALPNVTVIGDTTGGGSANPISLTLPNGWSYRVSRWIQYTAEKTIFEGTGLPPDIPLWITPAESAAGRDAILDRAIQYLQ
jgi:carboxyl-terminal processing protease